MTSPGAPDRAAGATATARTRRNRLAAASALGAAAVASGVLSLMLLTGTASALDPVVTPAPSPTLVSGNADWCLGDGKNASITAPLAGTRQLNAPDNPSGTVTSDAGSITVTGTDVSVTINEGFTASGIVVKGGSKYNLYNGPFVGPITVTGLVPPDNASGGPAGVSHVFACIDGTPPTSTATTEPPTTEPPTTEPPTTEPPTSTDPGTSSEPPTSTDPGTSSEPPTSTDPGTTSEPSSTTTTPGLPKTGPALGGLIAAAIALIAAGVALVVLRYARRAAGE